MEKLSDYQMQASYAEICKLHKKFLDNKGVLLPRLQSSDGSFTKDAIVLVYLFQGYPNTKIWSKAELTQIMRHYYPDVNDVQQARHLGHQKGWDILSGTRKDNEALEAHLQPGEYWLRTLERAYPGYRPNRREVTADFETLKKEYGYRCACCGSKEGELNLRNPSKITTLQEGHMDPSKRLEPGNIIPQCEECNRPDRNWWIYDKNGRVVGIGSETVIDRCSAMMQRKIYERLKLKFENNGSL